MTQAEDHWFKRHPRLALLLVNAVLLGALVIVLEIVLRLVITYNPGFYTAVTVRGRDLVYPYGVIKINSEGFPDEEWDLSKPHRVGYFGDSVTYGVGAGYGYRISEILEKAYPGFEHMNIGGIGLSISEKDIQWAANLATRLGMEKVIYLFNLNDIVPDAVATGEQQSWLSEIESHVLPYADWLRGSSYLYTFLRTKVKIFLEDRGFGFHGYEAFELFPEKNEGVIRQTAQRINRFHQVLASRGIEMILVLLPYEMQISREAEERYASLGVHWEQGFIGDETQRMVIAALDKDLRYYDAYYAFVDRGAVEDSRARNGLGEFFVYDKGDKLDWNHPNRAGHRAIAEWLIQQRILGDRVASGKPTLRD